MKYIENMYGQYIAWNIKNSQELLKVLIEYTSTPLTLFVNSSSMDRRIYSISNVYMFKIKTMANFEVFHG